MHARAGRRTAGLRCPRSPQPRRHIRNPILSDLSPFDAAAVVIVLAAVLSTLNARFTKLPQTIGLTLMGAALSILVIVVSKIFPFLGIRGWAHGFVASLDFKTTLLDGMLSFLLFAGALGIDLKAVRRGRWTILVLAVFGTLFSTALVGFGLKGLLMLTGQDLSLTWCLVFGALISPTDPVAVIAILKDAWLPPDLQATIAAESLFNDGVGVVIFSILLAAASGQGDMGLGKAAIMFAQEAGGGILAGLVVGAIAFVAMRATVDYVVEVLITLAVVTGGYAAAQALHVSGPVAMAVAGLIIGNHGFAYALSEEGEEYLVKFWQVIDEILNALLFLLIGLEAITVWRDNTIMALAAATVPIVLAARFVAVGMPLFLLKRIQNLGPAAVPLLWWGGLRGGISIALALSIPRGTGQEFILAATYACVIFSVLVQGSTIGRLARRYKPDEQDSAEESMASSV